MTRAMGHSPDGQDAKRLEAKPEWPGLAEGEMRPNMAAFLDALSRPTPVQIWLENVARLTRKEGDR